MKWIARICVFAAAFAFGAFAASLISGPTSGLFNCSPTFAPAARPVPARAPLKAENLLGTWIGTWGHDDGECALVIDRVEGNAFYGTLRKQGAIVRFEGTFNPATRMLRFDETEVVRLGADMAEWSLGTNSGLISHDGRILVGDGHDKWGQYGWAASNY